ncbi:MAG: hypothetical protein Q8876_00980 [Bacillota bacterium]|nr:hypothetical protein [Bacillota bacterium]
MMKYCPSCKHLFDDESMELCPDCKNIRMRSPKEDDQVFVLKAFGYERSRVSAALSDCGIPSVERPLKKEQSASAVTGIDTATVGIYVPYPAYSDAYDVLIGINAIKPDEDTLLSGEEFDEESQLQEMPEETIDETSNRYKINGKYISDEDREMMEAHDNMGHFKRSLWKTISIVLFLAIAAGIIFGIDAITGLIKSIF